jgi:MFS family permease
MPKSVITARWRLTALVVSQSAHFLANYSLRVYVVLRLASEGAAQRDTAWHLVAALFMLPSVFLVPVYGAVGNSLPKRAVLVGSAAYCLAVVALFAWLGQGWLACVACVALGSSLYTPTRHALLPAAAQDSDLPLPRVVGAVETTAVLSIVAGMALGGALLPITWGQLTAACSLPERWSDVLTRRCPSVPVAAILALSLLCLTTSLPVRFSSDVYRRESPRAAVGGFFRDLLRLLRFNPSRASLLAICLLRGLVTVAAGALIAERLSRSPNPTDQYPMLIWIAVLTMLGAAGGSFIAGLIGDRGRTLGLIPIGATAIALALGTIALTPLALSWLCVFVGVGGGIVNVPLLSTYQASVPPDARGNGMAILNTAGFASMTALSLLVAGLASVGVLTANGQLAFVIALAALSAGAAWWVLRGSTVELFAAGLRRPRSDKNADKGGRYAPSNQVDEQVA